MKLGVILLCGMNSSRLPGRALADVCGRPLLSYVYERLAPLQEDGISLVVAASDCWHDDIIQDYCQSHDIPCYRGSRDDVAEQLMGCAVANAFDWFARVNDDSPFVDVDLLRTGFAICSERYFDFITDLAPRSKFGGMSLEIFRSDWLEHIQQTQPLLVDPQDVTPRFYNNLHQIRYYHLAQETFQSEHSRFLIDSQEKLDWFRRLIAQHPGQWPHISWEDALADRQPLRKAA